MAPLLCPDFITGDVAKEGEESEQDEAGPTKVVTTEASIEVRARVLQLDYEGRSDGRSMHTILAHIAPRHLVLCHGSPQVRRHTGQWQLWGVSGALAQGFS